MMTTPQAIEQRNIVGPPYLQVLHLQIQPTMEQKDSGKKKVTFVMNIYRLLILIIIL